MARLTRPTIEGFAKALHGDVLHANDQEYDAARKVWNGLIDKHPALIARCADQRDVVRALNFARDHDLIVAVRGGEHNVAGFGTCDDGIVIDLSGMKRIEV